MTAIDRLTNHLIAALRQNLATRKPVAIPEAGRLLWQIFGELSSGRTYNQAGPNPISYQDIVGFSHIARWPLQPHHVTILRAMDAAYLEQAYKQQRRETNSGEPVRVSQPMTPAVFNAMFSK